MSDFLGSWVERKKVAVRRGGDDHGYHVKPYIYLVKGILATYMGTLTHYKKIPHLLTRLYLREFLRAIYVLLIRELQAR